jgi:hypothetical protein
MVSSDGLNLLMVQDEIVLPLPISTPCQKSNYVLIDFKSDVGDYVWEYKDPAMFGFFSVSYS